MSNPKYLTSYLQQQALAGLTDSQGEFTISHSEARRKLSRFTLPREAAWASKLIQAAVGWKMREVLVAQTRTETQFFFQDQQPSLLPHYKEIVRCLLSGETVAESPLEDFCVGLRAIVEQAELSFLLSVNDGETKPTPIYAGPYFGELSESERLHQRLDRGPGLTLTVRHGSVLGNFLLEELVDQARFGIPIVQEIKNHAYFSPIPIVLSGLHLEGMFSSPRLNNHRIPLLFSGLKSLKHSPAVFPLPPCFEEKQMSFLTHPRRARRSYGGSREFQGVFLLLAEPVRAPGGTRLAPASRSTMNWVRDGVVVQSSVLGLPTRQLGVHIFGNAAGLGTDLTGFQLTENKQRFDRERELLQAVARQLPTQVCEVEKFLARDTDEHSNEDSNFDEDQLSRSRVKKLVGGAGTGLLIYVVQPYLGFVVTTIGLVAPYVTEFSGRVSPEKARSDELLEEFCTLQRGLEAIGTDSQVSGSQKK